MADTIALIIAAILIAPGILMAFVPMLPALSYMFVIALVYAIYGGFAAVTGTEILILLGIVLVSIIIDHSAGILGAKYGGAHTKSLLWGMLAAFIGTFFVPPFGTFVGLFLGVLAAELYYKKPHDKAFKAAGSALLGSAVGVMANIALAATFMGLFIYFALF
ncbi:MAG TPA: DUF456 domain-containing protein [Candidatus Paceibacterota bacterium]